MSLFKTRGLNDQQTQNDDTEKHVDCPELQIKA